MSKSNMKPIQKMITNTAAAVVRAERTKVRGPKQVRAKNAIIDLPSAPVRENFSFVNREPRYTGVKDGIRISHTEYVGDLISSAAVNGFFVSAYNLNPSNAALFPWLSGVSTNYAECIPHSITVQIKSLAGTATPGCIMLASTPDVIDAEPLSKSTFMQLENSSRANAWETATHVVPKSILTRLPKYLTSTNSGAADDTTREIGQLFVASSGIGTGAAVFGELYVTYDFTFRHSQPPVIYSTFITATTGVLPLVPFGTAPFTLNTGSLLTYNENAAHVTTGYDMKIANSGTYIVTIILGAQYGATGTPTYGAKDAYGISLTTINLATGYPSIPTNATIWTFVVKDAPNPWFIYQNSPGTYLGAITTNVYISPFNYKSELITAVEPLRALEQRISKLENQDQSDIEEEAMQNGVLVTNRYTQDMSASFMQRVGEAVLTASKIKN